MRRLGFFLLAAMSLALMSCSKTAAPGGQQPVAQLPPGAEGVELAGKGLKAKDGYQLVRDSDTTFVVKRMSDGRNVAGGGCGCQSGAAGCTVTNQGSIAVCVGACPDCGLHLTINGATTLIRQ
ncbi:MAG TPA: hypothetical protein VL332_01790 [Candidatus Saccharimonadaceae bacterium]|jgi:hypothetical protein|nr:hypothetical protein [Candidatus Saccharimonadaceae bacterium]